MAIAKCKVTYNYRIVLSRYAYFAAWSAILPIFRYRRTLRTYNIHVVCKLPFSGESIYPMKAISQF